MTVLYPLLARDRYCDQEWEYASSGRCDWQVATPPDSRRCGRSSWSGSFYRYCQEHDQTARQAWNYGR